LSVIKEAERQGFEILQPDASWCGPRIVYFFARYLERNCTLDEVVRMCRTDKQGCTTLLNLVEGARLLGLDPVPITCSKRDLLELSGPAILCLGPKASDAEGRRVHFVGLVARKGDRYIVVDPSGGTDAFSISAETLTERFTGEAVLLENCSRPLVRPMWFTEAFLLCGCTSLFALFLALRFWWYLSRSRRSSLA
jgi:ABC-type bacteriocin/lantibiotic exporter with double-glycine peptidase domain